MLLGILISQSGIKINESALELIANMQEVEIRKEWRLSIFDNVSTIEHPYFKRN